MDYAGLNFRRWIIGEALAGIGLRGEQKVSVKQCREGSTLQL